MPVPVTRPVPIRLPSPPISTRTELAMGWLLLCCCPHVQYSVTINIPDSNGPERYSL